MFLTSIITAAAFFTFFAAVMVDSNGSSDIDISVRIQDNNVNDTILEFFNNCTCVAYYQCEEINRYMAVARSGLAGSQPPNCSDTNYYCCKSSGNNGGANTVDTTTVKTEPKDGATPSTTTVKPSIDDLVTKNIASNASCGLPRTVLTVKILNPETDSATTISGEHPWLVEIFEKRRNKDSYIYICAGTLIHPRVVMTVLHYVKSVSEQDLKVLATGEGVFQNLGENPDNERNVLKTIKHPKYYSGGLYNDIALLVLEKDFRYSEYSLNSICLPDLDQTFEGKRCLAVGWGKNPDHAIIPLKKVDIPVVNFQECENLLRKPRGAKFNLHESFLCAGGEEGKDTCDGDGGSPLICLGDNYNYVQVGIVSWGVACGVVDQPGVYTNVSYFKEWIVEELKAYDIKL